jgi:hypothetical protein
VVHDPGRKHQPLSFQWVTRVGSRGEEKKCKEISASALCASSPRRHRGGSATWEIGHRLAAGVSVCLTRRTLRRSLRAARDQRSAPGCDAACLLVRNVRSQAMHSRPMRAGWGQSEALGRQLPIVGARSVSRSPCDPDGLGIQPPPQLREFLLPADEERVGLAVPAIVVINPGQLLAS